MPREIVVWCRVLFLESFVRQSLAAATAAFSSTKSPSQTLVRLFPPLLLRFAGFGSAGGASDAIRSAVGGSGATGPGATGPGAAGSGATGSGATGSGDT